MSELAGPQGRVIAFEPVPTTFSLLAANTELFSHANVTLINAAVSNSLDIVGMDIPTWSTGLNNYYEAHLTSAQESELAVLTLSVDTLNIDHSIALVKIDAEGHEAFCWPACNNYSNNIALHSSLNIPPMRLTTA